MKLFLLGSTGMLGQSLMKVLQNSNITLITSSRSNSDYNIDLLKDASKIQEIILHEKPEVVINAAAIVDLKYCEVYPEHAYMINARVPALITEACRRTGSFFVQISTDHYYVNDQDKAHHEMHEITLLNEYARTKFAGETFALTSNNSLVVRTNIVGFRNRKGPPTFVEWVIGSLQANKEITGFEDFYTSSIDVDTFSTILVELLETRVTGIINIASSDTISKYEFINGLARLLGKEQCVRKGCLTEIGGVIRANSLGLETSRLSGYLSLHQIPSSKEVIANIYDQFKEGDYYEL